jgi:hypothetical protein
MMGPQYPAAGQLLVQLSEQARVASEASGPGGQGRSERLRDASQKASSFQVGVHSG